MFLVEWCMLVVVTVAYLLTGISAADWLCSIGWPYLAFVVCCLWGVLFVAVVLPALVV